MGLDQIKAVYGHWFNRGYNRFSDPSRGSLFGDDDTSADEVAFLNQAVNLSPDCYQDSRGCRDIDFDLLQETGVDYFVYTDNGFSMENSEEFSEGVASSGAPLVFIDTLYDNADCRDEEFAAQNAAECYHRSAIDIAKRIHDLAIAMNVVVPASVEQDRQAMCQAASTFTGTMQAAQNKGIRAMAASIFINLSVNIRLLDPNESWNLRMFEELGMPLMHTPDRNQLTDNQFFPECGESRIREECNDNTLYPIDVWIVESSTYGVAISADAKEFVPDKALIADQVAYFARNDGAISYKAITTTLTQMEQVFRSAERMHAETECTPVDTRTTDHTSAAGGLEPGQFACFNENFVEKAYTACEGVEVSTGGGDRGAEGSSSSSGYGCLGILAIVSVFFA